MESVYTFFVGYPQEDEQAAGDTQGQAEDVEGGEDPYFKRFLTAILNQNDAGGIFDWLLTFCVVVTLDKLFVFGRRVFERYYFHVIRHY
jgi:hypothetical protein